jgi:hypothetical protein
MAATAKKRASPKRAARARPVKSTKIPPILGLVVDAFADVQGASRPRMFSSENAFLVNGRLFAILVRASLVVKLPKERVDQIVDAGQGKPSIPVTAAS